VEAGLTAAVTYAGHYSTVGSHLRICSLLKSITFRVFHPVSLGSHITFSVPQRDLFYRGFSLFNPFDSLLY